MRKIITFALIFAFSLSLCIPNLAYAKGKEKEIEDLIEEKNAAIDCEALYILQEDEISKYSLPSLTLVLSVILPTRTKGEAIEIAGECSDPSETILVLAKRKGRGGGEVLLSYDESLQLVSELSLEEEDDDDDNDNDDDDDNDNDDDDDNDNDD